MSNIGEEKSGGGRMGFQPESVLKSISPPTTKEEDITSNTSCIKEANTLVVVPAMLHSIIEYATTITTTYPNVKLILIGGQSIGNGRLYKQTRQLFPNARFVQNSLLFFLITTITKKLSGFLGSNKAGASNLHVHGAKFDISIYCRLH